MCEISRTIALCVVCLLPSISIGQECSEARLGSVAEAAEYLQHASAARRRWYACGQPFSELQVRQPRKQFLCFLNI
jgi:hypothetical protein